MWCSRHIRLFAIFIGFLLISGLCRFAFAGERAAVPVIPKALADAEKGHAELMRRDHMDLMIHKRDETVHQGVRTKRYSLKACIACHAVLDNEKQPVSYSNPKHFCRTCHDYAAVTIDCFQCHTSKPPSSTGLSLNSVSDMSVQIKEYLK